MPASEGRRRTGGVDLFARGTLLLAARIFLSARPRSLAGDAARVVDLMDPPPKVDGLHLVPTRGPLVLVANHFQGGGWWVAWVAAAITRAVSGVRDPSARELHWVVLSEWRWFEMLGHWIPNPISSLLFPRAARIWGLITMPSRPSDVAGRARALRQVLSYLGGGSRKAALGGEAIGLFPEGLASVELREALPGTGAFLHRVSARGVPLLPVGAYQEGERLVVRIGAPFLLDEAPSGTQAEMDTWARERVMVAIGRLLPRALWGAYADAISREGAGPASS